MPLKYPSYKYRNAWKCTQILICEPLGGAIAAVVSLIKHICPSVGERLLKVSPELCSNLCVVSNIGVGQ